MAQVQDKQMKQSACEVCYEDLNNSTHKLVKCDKCEYKCCKQCIRSYFKDILNEPHCMKCKIQWEPEFVVAAVNKVYYNGEFKENRKAMLTTLEKSRLPDTQNDAKVFLLQEQLDEKILMIKSQIKELKVQIKVKEQEIILAHSEFLKEKKTGRKVFIMKCQSDCKGFLSSSYKCDLCNKHTCSKCFEVVNSECAEGEDHVCKPENVETVSLMKKETRACPGCSVRIYKIDGCNQMWCVECNTAFDWVSGKIVNGTIHNPHYYDYLKKNGGVPRAPGDVLCGGLPNIRSMYEKISVLRATGIMDGDISEIMLRNVGNIHQFVNHIHHLYTDLAQNNSYQTSLKNIRIKYILSRISEDEFSTSIFKEHKKDSKNQKKMQLLQMVDNVGTDLLQNYNAFLDKKVKRNQTQHIEQMIDMLNSFTKIVLYFNELSYKYHWEFNSFIGYINILVNNTQVNNENQCLTPELSAHDVIKYRY
jgi:hypothetical protein